MIEFELSANDRMILDAARKEGVIARKYARYYDEHEHEFPPQELEEAKELPNPLTVAGERTAEDSGTAVLTTLMQNAMTWGDYSVRVRRPRESLGNSALEATGTPEQKQKWGHLILAMAITEPGCGSDPSMVQTTAVRDGDQWLLNGEKIFVTAGCRCDGVVVWATTDKAAGRAGIKSFLIEKGTPGFTITHKEKKLGIRADDTAAMVLEDCRIPRENLLGGEVTAPKGSSGGFRGVMKTFNMTRPNVSARGLGIAEAALDFTRDALKQAGVEIEYGRALHLQSAAAEKFSRLEMLWEAATLSVWRAAWLADQEQENNTEASVCKAKAGMAVREITQGCIEILGPIGASRQHLVEKWFRDCRITDIYEGTGEIQRLIIARALLGYGRKELK